MSTRSEPRTEIHDLEYDAFLEEVHSFELWFQAVEGYLSGTVRGHRPDTRDVPPAVGSDRDRLISTLCNYCIGETAALERASGLIAIAPNRLTKVFLSTQVADEGRHLEVLLRRLADLGVADPETEVEKRSSPSLQLFRRRLLELVASRDWEAAIFAQNVILESLEYAVFHTHASNADPVTREVLERVIKNERRHIGFGENELGRKLAHSPHIRARLGQVRSQLDHLVLDMLENTAREIGVDRHEQERLGRTYRESVERLGFGS